MATIEIRHPHHTSLDDARQRTRLMLNDLQRERSELFQSIDWRGDDEAAAKGRGFKALFKLDAEKISVDIDLSLVLRPLKNRIEARLISRLTEEFSPTS